LIDMTCKNLYEGVHYNNGGLFALVANESATKNHTSVLREQ